MADDDLWQCWALEHREGMSVATLVLVHEGLDEAGALEAQGRDVERRYVTRPSDLERVYQAVFSAYPAVKRVYASRWAWSRSCVA